MIKNINTRHRKVPFKSSTKATDIISTSFKHLPRETVRKSHLLLMSPQNLTSKQQEMLLLFCSKLNGDDYDLPALIEGVPQSEQDKFLACPTFEFHSNVLCEWFNIEKTQLYSRITPIAESLSKQVFAYKEEDAKGGEFKFRTLFSEISYKNSTLKLIPNNLMFRMLIDYSKGYALINHHTFRAISGEYGKQLYKLLSRWKEDTNPMRTILIADLQLLFGVFDKKGKAIKASLAKPSMFIARVIEPAIKELMAVEDVKKELLFNKSKDGTHIGMELFKKGRTFHEVEFLYQWVTVKSKPEMNESSALQIIQDLAITKRLINKVELSVDELTTLYVAFKFIKADDKAGTILEQIQNKKNEVEFKEKTIDVPNTKAQKLLNDLALLEEELGVN